MIAIAQIEKARTAGQIKVLEALDAIKVQGFAFAQAEQWMPDFYTVSKIATNDKSQLLEAMFLIICTKYLQDHR